MALKLFPAGYSSFFQLVLAADDLECTALLTIIDRQSQSPVALLGDHPVVHVAQPVQFALQAKGWNPGGLARYIHDLVTQLVHGDVPFVDQAEDQFCLTTPADRIAVLIVLWAVKQAFLRQVFCDFLSHSGSFLPGHPVIALRVDAKVFAATARGTMHNTGSLGGAYVFPRDDGMNDTLLCRKFVEWAAILPAHHITTL